MRLLLDTHVLLWWLADDERLARGAASDLIRDAENDTVVSAVSAWEISIKQALGKLAAPYDLPEQIVASGFQELPVTIRHSMAAGALPAHHQDPFDRMLIAQALAEQLTLVSADRRMALYDVPLIAT